MTVVTRVTPASRPTRLRYAIGWRITRGLRLAIKGALLLAAGAALTPVVLVALGYRPTVVRADTMNPAMQRGDLIVNEPLPPSSVQVGDVITFRDAERAGAVFTERVLAAGEDSGEHTFSTKGDASVEAHEWSTPGEAEVARVAYRVPVLGDPVHLAARLPFGQILALGVVLTVVVKLGRRFVLA